MKVDVLGVDTVDGALGSRQLSEDPEGPLPRPIGQGGTGDELFNGPVRAVGRSVVIVGMVMLRTLMMAVMPVVSGISVAPSGLVVRVLVAVMIVLVVTLLRMARLIRCLALDRDEELLRADPPSPRLDQLEAPILGKLEGTEPFLHVGQGHAQIQKGR